MGHAIADNYKLQQQIVLLQRIVYLQVASRRVIQTGALFMIVFGMLGKIGALFVIIPDPIIGGLFMVMFGKTSFCYHFRPCGPQCFYGHLW